MTVDTEGDNLWNWKEGKKISTNNSKYIAPFQELCEKYKIIPVYLVNYEMANDNNFVMYIKNKAKKGLCEIGMHLHAWNSPPIFKLPKKYSGNSYITEYSKKIIYDKHKYLKDLIIKRFDVVPVSYRSGRWATNDVLFEVLDELGFLVDCSITPGINHRACGRTVSKSNNYRNEKKTPRLIRNNLLEVPMTTSLKHHFYGNSLKRKIINLIRGEERWLRPALQTEKEMLSLINDDLKSHKSYIMFMIHSSELMPKGSPYCDTQADVDFLLNKLENIFIQIQHLGKGVSLKDFYNFIGSDINEKS